MPVPTNPPILEDEVTLARYPFLPQAAGWIRQMAVDHQIDLDELLEGRMMEEARIRAKVRLESTINSNEGIQVTTKDLHTVKGRIIEAFSFYYARLVVCASEDERLIARWAQAEAETAERLLEKERTHFEVIARTYISKLQQKAEEATPLTAATYGARRPQAKEAEWQIGLSDYIEICPKITGERWRLPNADITGGLVTLFEDPKYPSKRKVARLLRERIKKAIEEEALEKMQEVTADLAIRLAEPVGMVRNLMASKASEAISLVGAEESDWPPCMAKIVSDLATGVNVNHFGRLFLASISSSLALPQESVVDFFRGAPDFSEATTAYQVGHVYDHGYTPSGCSKLKINHNCPIHAGDNRLCDMPWMDHPLKYIRATQRWKSRNQAAQAAVEEKVQPQENSDAND